MYGLSQLQSISTMILAAALVASGIYIMLLRSQVVAIESEKITLVTKLSVSQANLLQLQNDITAQNLAIQRLKTAADERVARGLEEIAKARASAASSEAKASAILAKRVPQGANICESANSLFNEEIRNGRK